MKSVGTLPGLGGGAVLTVAYSVAGTLGLGLAEVHPSISAVWPPTGIAIAALLLMGRSLWPAIFAGALLVNLATSSFAVAICIAAGNTAEALVAAWLINRFAGGRAAFARPRSFFVFVLYGAIASSMVGASIGVNTLAVSGSLPWSRFDAAWTTWWLGDAIGAILITPLIVLWAERRPTWSWPRTAELAALAASLALVSWIAFGGSLLTVHHDPLTFLPIPLLVWAGFRFQPCTVAAANLLMAGIAIAGAAAGNGPFAQLPSADGLLMLQLCLGFMASTGLTVALAANESRENALALQESRRELERRVQDRTAKLTEANEVLAAEIGERTEAQRELAESETRFRDLVESAPDAIVIIDAAGRIEIVNSQTERFFGYTRQELVGQPLELLVPERFREQHVRDRLAYMGNPRVRAMGEGAELFGRPIASASSSWSTSRHRRANSSPPNRAVRSSGRAMTCRRSATASSSASPT